VKQWYARADKKSVVCNQKEDPIDDDDMFKLAAELHENECEYEAVNNWALENVREWPHNPRAQPASDRLLGLFAKPRTFGRYTGHDMPQRGDGRRQGLQNARRVDSARFRSGASAERHARAHKAIARLLSRVAAAVGSSVFGSHGPARQ
jgi:hypothetical protein